MNADKRPTFRTAASELDDLQAGPLAERTELPPVWLARATFPSRGVEHADDLPIAPLFKPNLTRAILAGAVARERPTGEVDTAELVRAICLGQIPRTLPRRSVVGLGHRVAMLIDAGKGMKAFATDIDGLIDEAIQVVGYDRLQVAWFQDNPALGVRVADGEDVTPFRAPNAGETVLVVSDLGLGTGVADGRQGGLADWVVFAEWAARRDCQVTAIVPFAASRFPKPLHARMRILTWDRSTSVRDLRRGTSKSNEEYGRTATARAMIGRLASEARALAERASLAARIEPNLLRALRLEVEPALPVDAEAELFWSPLVDVHSTAGIVLRANVLDELRQSLGASTPTLDASWNVTKTLHERGPRALFHEEELTYLTVRGIDDPARAARARTLLRELVAGFHDGRLTMWGERAVLRIPRELFAIEEARMLAAGVARSSGNSRIWSRLPKELSPDAYSWLGGTADELRPFYVGLVDGGISFGPQAFSQSHKIVVPAAGPVDVEIEWRDGDGTSRQQRRLDRKGEKTFDVVARAIEFRVLGASRYRIWAAAPNRQTSRKLPSPIVRLFLSGVSDEFGDYCNALRRALTRPNVEVKIQQDFKALGGDTLKMLQEWIEQCEAVVHFVGEMAGSMPAATSVDDLLRRRPDLEAKLAARGLGRDALQFLTYTQWEAWIAVGFDKDLLIVQPAKGVALGPNFAPTNNFARGADAAPDAASGDQSLSRSALHER